MPSKILVVDDEPDFCEAVRDLLKGDGFSVTEAYDGDQALAAYKRERPDVVLLDVRMPGQSGLEVLKGIGRQTHDALVIMTTAVDEVATAVEAMKLGAYDYLVKPISTEHLNATLDRAREHFALKQEIGRRRALQRDEFSLEGDVIVASPSMMEVFKLAGTLGRADRATVLITGETGTGKEIVARAIHRSSPRSDQPLVVVNCGAIPKDLMEAELLGYAKGAFTGALTGGKKGKVELAHQGTLFLDEIAELPAGAQTVLLRILDGQPFYPVGSNREVQAEVRVIAATNRDLRSAVSEGSFREDLFYRLNVAHIHLPPLRERAEDILPMAQSFLKEFNQEYGKSFESISQEVASRLLSYPWKGNVREMRNAIERVVLYEEDSEVRVEHLAFLEASRPKGNDSASGSSGFSLPSEGVDIEKVFRELIVQALDRTEYNQSKAARLLGISLPTFRYRMEKYGLKS
ncbi:MAG: sigma-54 dependent transcriptional regulator [bacterium]|nr:sigma-54 dependent transcriptional regulator [bacterium]